MQYSLAKYFTSSTVWKYRRLPTWLDYLNLKRCTVKYQCWKGLEMVCTYEMWMYLNKENKKERESAVVIFSWITKFLHNLHLLAKFNFRNSIVKYLLVWLNNWTRQPGCIHHWPMKKHIYISSNSFFVNLLLEKLWVYRQNILCLLETDTNQFSNLFLTYY